MNASRIAAAAAGFIRWTMATIVGLCWGGLTTWGLSGLLVAAGLGESIPAGVAVIVASGVMSFAGMAFMLVITDSATD